MNSITASCYCIAYFTLAVSCSLAPNRHNICSKRIDSSNHTAKQRENARRKKIDEIETPQQTTNGMWSRNVECCAEVVAPPRYTTAAAAVWRTVCVCVSCYILSTNKSNHRTAHTSTLQLRWTMAWIGNDRSSVCVWARSCQSHRWSHSIHPLLAHTYAQRTSTTTNICITKWNKLLNMRGELESQVRTIDQTEIMMQLIWSH